MSVSLIGLGKIGTAILPHLMPLGEDVKIWNRSGAAIDRLIKPGVTPASDISDAFAADIVLSVLFDDEAVRSVVTAERLQGASDRGSLHICLSTVSPDLTEELENLHASLGVGYLAAPLFGRPEAVARREANICVAGDDACIERGRPYLECFGRVWRVGEKPRQASVAKLCGNFMIGAAIESMAEAASLISAGNGDAAAFMSLMTETLFSSPVYRNYAASVLGTATLPPSGLALPMKDMALLSAVARNASVHTKVLDALRANLSSADAAGLGDQDWSVALGKSARRVMTA
jgi:3-hydroxyisobutyrate dehydrogenase-like beta-hydroxyacid dehydrogenase